MVPLVAKPRRAPVVALAAAAATLAVVVPLAVLAATHDAPAGNSSLAVRGEQGVTALDGAVIEAGPAPELLWISGEGDDIAAVSYALYRDDDMVASGETATGPEYVLVGAGEVAMAPGRYELLATATTHSGDERRQAAIFEAVRP